MGAVARSSTARTSPIFQVIQLPSAALLLICCFVVFVFVFVLLSVLSLLVVCRLSSVVTCWVHSQDCIFELCSFAILKFSFVLNSLGRLRIMSADAHYRLCNLHLSVRARARHRFLDWAWVFNGARSPPRELSVVQR